MKSCPACNRTYSDDSFTFCLDDGALLSAPYDPQATLRIPAARSTDQTTEILGATPQADSRSPRQQTTARPSNPLNYQPEAGAYTSPQKRSGRRTGVIVGSVIATLIVAVLILGYVVWSGNQSTQSEASKADANIQANRPPVPTPNATPNSNVNTNAIAQATPKPLGDPHLPWLDGVWEGTARQNTPKISYSIKLTAENNSYSIEYPSLRCGGKWNVQEMSADHAKFKEVITHGGERCSSDGDILVEKTGEGQISYKYTLPFIGEIVSGTLSKKSP
ncbi:MAG: hypothetical protein DMF68_05525 [Acidobacteria bacterium]|nr:MAG: hypothetical protein DMF68_05525 [Acidobacteriota bacterium]